MIITIHGTDQGDGPNGGWMFDVYKDAEDAEALPEDSDDGGLCTGSLKDAVEMATEQALDLITRDCKHLFCTDDGACDQCGQPAPAGTLVRDCMNCERTFWTPATNPTGVCRDCLRF